MAWQLNGVMLSAVLLKKEGAKYTAAYPVYFYHSASYGTTIMKVLGNGIDTKSQLETGETLRITFSTRAAVNDIEDIIA